MGTEVANLTLVLMPIRIGDCSVLGHGALPPLCPNTGAIFKKQRSLAVLEPVFPVAPVGALGVVVIISPLALELVVQDLSLVDVLVGVLDFAQARALTLTKLALVHSTLDAYLVPAALEQTLVSQFLNLSIVDCA